MDLLNLWNLYNIYSSPPIPLQLQTLSDPSRAEQEVGRSESTGLLGVVVPVFPCQPLTYCTSHCYAPLAAIHAALERDGINTLKLPDRKSVV